MPQAFVDTLEHLLLAEETFVDELRHTQAAHNLSAGRKELLEHLRVLIKSDNLSLIITCEKARACSRFGHTRVARQMVPGKARDAGKGVPLAKFRNAAWGPFATQPFGPGQFLRDAASFVVHLQQANFSPHSLPHSETAPGADADETGTGPSLQVHVLKRVLGAGRVEITPEKAGQGTAFGDEQLDQGLGIGKQGGVLRGRIGVMGEMAGDAAGIITFKVSLKIPLGSVPVLR